LVRSALKRMDGHHAATPRVVHHAATPRVVSTRLRRVISVRGYAASRTLGKWSKKFFYIFPFILALFATTFKLGEIDLTTFEFLTTTQGCLLIGPLGTPQVAEKFFYDFSLHIGTISNNF